MQIGKTIKRIAAASTAALMLGATLGGALAAAKLADYPAPFIKSGVLDNTVFVVGKTAATSDVMGAIDLAAALQAEAVSKQAVSVGTSVAPSIEDGVKIEKSGNHFLLNDDIENVQDTGLDETDMDMLAKGIFEDNQGDNKGDTEYTQDLTFQDGAGVVSLQQPDDMKGGIYMEFPKSNAVYSYTLEFDQTVDYNEDDVTGDLVGTTLDIQGNTYTVTEASLDGTDALDKLKLVAGDSTLWLVQDQPYTVGSHTVTVVDVAEATGDDDASCGINVDGTTVWVDKDSTEEIAGLSVGVLDVKAVHSKDFDQDTCELSLGSNEVVLESGSPVEVNGAEIDGSEVTFDSTGAGSDGAWDGFTVTFEEGGMDSAPHDDDIFLTEGQAWTDPVFGNFKVAFAGMTADYETLRFESSGEDATFTFTNNDGKEVELPFHWTSGTEPFLGTDDTERLLLPGEQSGLEAEGTMLLYTTQGGEVHVLEITNLVCDTAENKTTIRDLTYGTEYKDKELANDCGSAEDITLGSLGTINLNLDDNLVGYTASATKGNGEPESKYEGNFTFSNDTVFFTEKEGDETSPVTVKFDAVYDSGDDESIELNATSGITLNINNDEGDDDVQWGASAKGTLGKVDSKDDQWVEFMHPEEDAYANVFVAPLKSEVVGGGSSGSVTADKVNPFSVGLAALDEDAEGMTKNMIVVGGTCVNTIAAELLGNPTNCVEGFEAGKATLKFFDRKGKAALLVAGYDAQDTLNAAYVLAQHGKKYAEEFKTLNDEVTLVVTDMEKVVFNTA